MLDLDVNYEILSFSIGDTKAGTKMGKMQIKNIENSSILNCVLWEETLKRIPVNYTRAGNIIKIITARYNEQYNNCLLNNFELVSQAAIGISIEKSEEYFSKIIEVVKNFKNEKLKNFVLEYLNSNKDRFLICPAAKQMHHNYIGGLIVHTYECVELAITILPKVTKYLNKDEVIAAAILHDIGKIFEYEVDKTSGLIDYNESFKKDWISHSQYGYTLCMSKGFYNIAKMIASHHGRAEWGAMVDLGERDLEPFYYIIHHIDDLSAKFGATSINEIKDL